MKFAGAPKGKYDWAPYDAAKKALLKEACPDGTLLLSIVCLFVIVLFLFVVIVLFLFVVIVLLLFVERSVS